MAVTDAQVRKLMKEMAKDGELNKAALKSGMHRQTAAKYVASGKLPSELKNPRRYRTRDDPFEADWNSVLAPMLVDAPELEAVALFDWLTSRRPGAYSEGQVRTLQRRLKRWRAQNGPDKEVFFPQEHRAGEAMQTDFTHGSELGVMIGGEPFAHLLCHPVLPYSNWEWATVCRSESIAALRRGVQSAVFKLGRVPMWHQTDNSTAATHNLSSGKREFNDEYAALMRHLGMKPRTTGIGEKEQNGDVESANGALKRRLKQYLLLRGSRDFESVSEYENWVQWVIERANERRGKRIAEDLAQMTPLRVARLPEFSDLEVPVSYASTIRVKHNTYSVPSRLVRERVSVRVYDDRIEVRHDGVLQMTCERLLGSGGVRVDYRHVIWSLVRKPGAFERYRYREELFPSVTFRRAYDALAAAHTSRQSDIGYLRLLHLAATTMETEVEAAVQLLIEDGRVPDADVVKELIGKEAVEVPDLKVPDVDLAEYDALIGAAQEVAS